MKADVQQVLGVVGTLRQLVRSSNVNPLSRNKPLDLPDPVITESLRAGKNYGTIVPSLTLDSSGMPRPGGVWTYDRPTTYHRLLGFDGYSHYAVPPIGIGWNAGISNGLNPIDWSGDDTAFIYLTIDRSQIPGNVEGCLHLPEMTFGGQAANAMYIWAAIISGGHVYAKRTSRSISQINTVAGKYDNIIFYIRSASGHTADFGGALASISNDFSIQLFIGGTAIDETAGNCATQNLANITYKYSLNCRDGMDVKSFTNVVAPWNKGLSASFSTLASLVYQETGNYRKFRFTNDAVVRLARSVIPEPSVQDFVYRVDVHFEGISGGFAGQPMPVDKVITQGAAASVPSGGSTTVTIPLKNIDVYAPVGEYSSVTLSISGARRDIDNYIELETRTYLIQQNSNTVL